MAVHDSPARPARRHRRQGRLVGQVPAQPLEDRLAQQAACVMELHRTSAMGMCRIMSEARCGATRLASTVGSIQVALGFLMGTDSGQVLRIRRSSSP